MQQAVERDSQASQPGSARGSGGGGGGGGGGTKRRAMAWDVRTTTPVRTRVSVLELLTKYEEQDVPASGGSGSGGSGGGVAPPQRPRRHPRQQQQHQQHQQQSTQRQRQQKAAPRQQHGGGTQRSQSARRGGRSGGAHNAGRTRRRGSSSVSGAGAPADSGAAQRPRTDSAASFLPSTSTWGRRASDASAASAGSGNAGGQAAATPSPAAAAKAAGADAQAAGVPHKATAPTERDGTGSGTGSAGDEAPSDGGAAPAAGATTDDSHVDDRTKAPSPIHSGGDQSSAASRSGGKRGRGDLSVLTLSSPGGSGGASPVAQSSPEISPFSAGSGGLLMSPMQVMWADLLEDKAHRLRSPPRASPHGDAGLQLHKVCVAVCVAILVCARACAQQACACVLASCLPETVIAGAPPAVPFRDEATAGGASDGGHGAPSPAALGAPEATSVRVSPWPPTVSPCWAVGLTNARA